MDIMDSQTASPNLNTLKEHLSKTPQKPAFPLGDVRKWSNSSKIDERNGAILASVINTSDRNFDNIIHHYLQISLPIHPSIEPSHLSICLICKHRCPVHTEEQLLVGTAVGRVADSKKRSQPTNQPLVGR